VTTEAQTRTQPTLEDQSVATAEESRRLRRAGGLLSIIGAVAMGTGGAFYTSTGADLWGLVDGDVDINTYLADAAASVSTLLVAHTIWIAGIVALTLGGVLLTGRSSDHTSTAARATYTIGAALAIPAFMTMIALTRLAETGADAPALTEALAFLGARLDDLATVIVVGLGPVLITIANRRTWMPGWLAALGVASGAAGLLSIISMFFGQSASLGFLIVPIGLAWTLAAGIVTIRAT